MEIQLNGTHLTETLQWFLPTCPYQLRKEAKCMHANMAKINLKVTWSICKILPIVIPSSYFLVVLLDTSVGLRPWFLHISLWNFSIFARLRSFFLFSILNFIKTSLHLCSSKLPYFSFASGITLLLHVVRTLSFRIFLSLLSRIWIELLPAFLKTKWHKYRLN